MKIAILDLTTHPQPLLSGLPRAGDQILNWLAPAFTDADFTIYDLAEAGDPTPTPNAFDGLITAEATFGSIFGRSSTSSYPNPMSRYPSCCKKTAIFMSSNSL